MRQLRSLSLGIVSSVLLALALPNELFAWGNPALGLVALAPLYVALETTRSYRGSFAVGAVFGGLAHGLSSYWLWFFKGFRFWTLGTTIIAYMLVYGFVGLYLRGALKRGGLARPLVFAMSWAVFEWGKSTGFLGYPWGILAHSWNTVLPAVQIVESTGVYGLSFSLALVSATLAELLCSPPAMLPSPLDTAAERNPLGPLRFSLPARPLGGESRFLALGQLVVSAVLFACILGYGFVALNRPREPRGFVDAVMVQQNVDSWSGSEAENLSVSIGLAREAILESAVKPDIVLFSETTLRRPWNGFKRFYARTPAKDPLAGFIADTGAYLFTGAPEILDYETFAATNSVILINPRGQQVGSYAKIHPVPFAEAIPFWEYDPVRNFIQDVVGLESGWVMGSERVIFELPTKGAGTVRFAAPICFEDAFAYLCREFALEGAEMLVNLTNDAWSKTDSAEIQHFVAARFRTVELRRTLVRSTNGGVSAVVGPDGSILESLPLFESTSRAVRIPVYTGETTPYLSYGDWFIAALACILLALALILYIDGAISRKESV
ncbi:MAG: apolipoprotein N-acyltransferase [Spirochaetes bacterium]|nr:apolipoprotein N-acyltransferase [Spirochaetota bacterium]MBU1079598.1 apolipoprotein N-acyltransferase [Spirochaetota bacterium]